MESLRSRFAKLVLRQLVKRRNQGPLNVQRNRRLDQPRPKACTLRPCTAKALSLGGVASHQIVPPKPTNDLVLYYLHGGAFVAGPLWLHWRLLRTLCLYTGAIAYLADYRKAPEHHCLEGLADAEAAYLAIRAQHPNSRVVVLGDSAGGNLTLVLALLLRDKQLPLPDRLALLSPALDASFSNPKISDIAPKDPFLSLSGVKQAAQLWARDLPLDDWRLSPINAHYKGLPPTQLQIGTADLLWPDCQRFRDQAIADGLALEYIEAPNMIHVWTAAGPFIPESRKAVQQLVRFIEAAKP